MLSASRGVIRADDEAGFVAAFRRIAAILASPDVRGRGEAAVHILVEDFVPGIEVALECLLVNGALVTLALFDKPDPLDGPYFEETIYVTPSRLADAQAVVRSARPGRDSPRPARRPGPRRAATRPGRRRRDRAFMIEIAARSIGGLCSRTLSFGTGMSSRRSSCATPSGCPSPRSSAIVGPPA
jgi:hypothetical protein